MSLSKKLCLRSDSLKRQSFSERICDDLSEVILQYLSLKDKLKLECVSKQFQRTVYQKQYDFDEKFLDFLRQQNRIRKSCLECFSSILKKCSNIKTIHLSESRLFPSNLEIISKNFNNLPEIQLNFSSLSDELFTKYVEKFGSKGRPFVINFETNWNRLISLPNIEEIMFAYNWFPPNSEPIIQLNFDKLNKCHINFRDNNRIENIESIDKLFDKFKSLRHLDVSNYCCKELTESFKKIIVKQVSKLKKLIDLMLCSTISAKLFEQIALNCSHLKKINFLINIESTDDFKQLSSQLYSSLKALKQLKRLNLGIYSRNEVNHNIFSLKSFGRLPVITHLRLYSLFYWKIDETFIEDIETVFPNIQFLRIGFEFEGSFDELKQRLIGLITRMERLQTIVFQLKYELIRLNERNKRIIIKSSRKWKTIEFI